MIRHSLFAIRPSPTIAWGLVTVIVIGGCQGVAGGRRPRFDAYASKGRIRNIACIYDLKPWLNLDAAGDSDPEGVWFRVFLDPGTGKGVLRDGTFHVEVYKLQRTSSGAPQRTLVSDWHYPTSDFSPIKSKLLGMGYLLQLRWATKNIAGYEIEVVTRYEDPEGHVIGAGTKRLRVPKYAS